MSSLLLALLMLEAASLGIRASTPATEPGSTRPSTAMRVARDETTGQIIAPEHSGPVLTVEEMQSLARREAEGLVTIRNPDGSESLIHDGRFTDYTVIRRGPDGRLQFQCVHGRSGVQHALRPAAPPTPSMEDR